MCSTWNLACASYGGSGQIRFVKKPLKSLNRPRDEICLCFVVTMLAVQSVPSRALGTADLWQFLRVETTHTCWRSSEMRSPG